MSRIGTLRLTGRDGQFYVLDDEGRQVGRGQAAPSVAMPGYVTLIFYGQGAPAPIRVPIDWMAALESDHGD